MKQTEIAKKAKQLKAGEVVKIDGNWFRAVRLPSGCEVGACSCCDVDSLCKGDVAKVCTELDWPTWNKWYLKLAHR